MNERILWEKFKKTGKIEDYLLYLMVKRYKRLSERDILGQVK